MVWTEVGLRVAVLLGVLAGAQGVGSVLSDEGGGANIGFGLAVLVLMIGICGVWGLLDGRRVGLRRSLVVWAAAAGLTAVLQVLLIAAMDGGFSATVILSDLVLLSPLTRHDALHARPGGGGDRQRHAAAAPRCLTTPRCMTGPVDRGQAGAREPRSTRATPTAVTATPSHDTAESCSPKSRNASSAVAGGTR